MYLKPTVDDSSFLPLEVQQSSTCRMKSYNVESQINLESTSRSVNSLLGIESLGTRAGTDKLDEFPDNKKDKLIKSILAKSPQSYKK